ncbi:MAG: bifunctional nuclease family protein [Candidatus Omnitrophota bacterium]|nr:bifunctional nuclease family protein [Candidatus Omnitrophota bacterium]
MVEMELFKIKINEKSDIQTIVLKEKSGKRLFSIGVGIPEINAIKLKAVGAIPPRPLTHDLLNNVIRQLNARIEKIIIDKLELNIFYAKIILQTGNNGIKKIDARPSDSIALALRAKAPIFTAEEVLEAVATTYSE